MRPDSVAFPNRVLLSALRCRLVVKGVHLMRYSFLALLVCAPLAGCSSGVAPSSVTYGAAQYRAIGPQQTYGVRPEVKRAIKVPAAAVTCLTTGAAKGLVLLGETFDCLLESFTPPEVVAVQQYAPEPMGACAPLAGPSCASGACSPPPVQTPALPRGACLPPGK